MIGIVTAKPVSCGVDSFWTRARNLCQPAYREPVEPVRGPDPPFPRVILENRLMEKASRIDGLPGNIGPDFGEPNTVEEIDKPSITDHIKLIRLILRDRKNGRGR